MTKLHITVWYNTICVQATQVLVSLMQDKTNNTKILKALILFHIHIFYLNYNNN